MMLLGTDFKFRDDLKTDTTPVELLSGPFSGVVYRYTTISVKEDKDHATMNFGFEIIEPGKFKKRKLKKDQKFHEYAGLILNTLLIMQFEGDNESREGDPEEPVS